MQKIPNIQTPNYETMQQHRDNPPPEYEEHKLGSAQPDHDPFDAVAAAPAGIPVERIAAERFPAEGLPTESVPPETQAVDFMTPEARP